MKSINSQLNSLMNGVFIIMKPIISKLDNLIYRTYHKVLSSVGGKTACHNFYKLNTILYQYGWRARNRTSHITWHTQTSEGQDIYLKIKNLFE